MTTRRPWFAFCLLLTLCLAPRWIFAQNERVAVKVGKDKVEFTILGQPAGTYHIQGYSKPILWPVLAPSGVEVTRAWPMRPDGAKGTTDHPHQQSVWFCHGDVIPKGIELKQTIKGVKGVDFWSLAKGHGKIVCTAAAERPRGPFSAGIDTENEWRTADGQKILDERRSVTLYDFGKARLWVFDIQLHASVCPIVFGDTKEGAMAIRVHDELREKGGTGRLQNADGKKGAKECWGQQSDWCDYSGTVNGQKVGIAIFDDPKNVCRACYHARDYGLNAANPFGRYAHARFPATKGNEKLVELAKGGRLHLRYGILVHEGGTEDGRVADYYQRFLRLREKQ